MNPQELIDIIPDRRSDDPFATDPGSPRWIFFDDERPSPEERAHREELIEAEERESMMRPLDWVDPEIDRYHERMEARRYAGWLSSWYARNRPDYREKLLGSIVEIELNPDSYLSHIREDLNGKLSGIEIENLWAKLSVYKAVKDILRKPCVNAIHKRTPHLRYRYLADKRQVVDDYGNLTEVNYPEPIPYIAHSTKRVIEGAEKLSAWNEIHASLNGHGGVDEVPRPPMRTLFSNPDGRRILNETAKTRSPIQAKMAFARNHKLEAERVMVERVCCDWNPSWLRKHRLRNPGKSIYVVSARKLSNETASHYYDPNPSFIERVNKDGEWINEYQWASGKLVRIPEPKDSPDRYIPIFPEGAHVLSVRDLERAVLAGAEFADDETDIFASNFELEPVNDERELNEEFTKRPVEALSEQEQDLYQALIAVEQFDLAELILIDFDCVPIHSGILQQVAATLYNKMEPKESNQFWIDLCDELPKRLINTLAIFLGEIASSFDDDPESVGYAAAGE